MNWRRLLRQLLLAVAIGVMIAMGGYIGLRVLLGKPFDTLKVESELRGKLEEEGLLARMVATSHEAMNGGKIERRLIDDLRKNHGYFEMPARLKADELDCVEFWYGGADQHWGVIVTKPGTKPRQWAYLHEWEKDVWFFSEIAPR